jgi:lipoyl(octanoyl) transferase
MKPGRWVDLGLREYGAVWELQKRLVTLRQQDAVPDTLLLVEHPEVITLGRRAGAREHLRAVGNIPLFEVERGGDVTWHGPGQLVGYPIVRLDEGERDLHAYLRALEEALLGTCARVGVAARRNPGWTGAWIDEPLGLKKVASIGVAVRRWVTLHGFALNVSTDLSRFAAIDPCGLDATVMTSLSRAAGRPLSVDALKPLVAAELGAALSRDFVASALTGE